MRLRGFGVFGLALVVAGCDVRPEQITAPGDAPAALSTSSALSVSVSGPTDIYEAGMYDWVASASGGCDPSQRTYTWYGGANLDSPIAYGATITWYIDETWESRSMKLVVEEPGHGSATTYVHVTNHLYNTGGGGLDQ